MAACKCSDIMEPLVALDAVSYPSELQASAVFSIAYSGLALLAGYVDFELAAGYQFGPLPCTPHSGIPRRLLLGQPTVGDFGAALCGL